MNDEKLRKDIQHAMDTRLSGLTGDPALALSLRTRESANRQMKKRKTAALIVAVVLLLAALTGLAWTLPMDFFSGVAQITLTNGDYEDWGLAEKRCLIAIMEKYGLMDEQTCRRLRRSSETMIDAFMLERYAPETFPNDLDTISLMRIAWVELGAYTDWTNETWCLFTDMMFETGMWTNENDVDVYAMPGKEAVSPDTAIAIAKQQLLKDSISSAEVAQAQIIWHYLTHASDVERTGWKYRITFRFADRREVYVHLTPDGKRL